jgi:hypothetical protein
MANTGNRSRQAQVERAAVLELFAAHHAHVKPAAEEPTEQQQPPPPPLNLLSWKFNRMYPQDQVIFEVQEL